jgi:hypothetical protein
MMTMRFRLSSAILTAGALAVFLGGCGAISGLNPFNRQEKLLPGERQSVLPRAGDEIAGGTPSIGGASGLADWSQSGGNAANAPGNVSLSGTSGEAAWRARVIESSGKRGVRPSVPPLVYGGRIFAYDATGTVTSVAPGGARAWSVSLAPGEEKSKAQGGGIAAAGSAIYVATGFGELVALDAATGNRLWASPLGAPAHSAPSAAGGKVFVGERHQRAARSQPVGRDGSVAVPRHPGKGGRALRRQPRRVGRHRRGALFVGRDNCFRCRLRRHEMGRYGASFVAHAGRLRPHRRGGEPDHL